MANAKDILEAILNVRKAVGTVAKNGKNTFHKYDYATANDVIHEVREAMNKEGIIVVPTGAADISFTKDGQVQNYTQHYLLALAGSTSTLNVAVRCAGEDKSDKGPYKANTGALKYLLLQTFLLPTDDDPENDVKHPVKNNPPKQNNPAPKAPAKKIEVGDEPPEIPEHCEGKDTQIDAITKMILWMVSGDTDRAKELLYDQTKFVGKDGQEIGINSIAHLKDKSDKWIGKIYGTVKEKFLSEVELYKSGMGPDSGNDDDLPF